MRTFTAKPIKDIVKLTEETIKIKDGQKRLDEIKKEQEFQKQVLFAQEDIMLNITKRARAGLYHTTSNFFIFKFFSTLSPVEQDRFIFVVMQPFKNAGYRTSITHPSLSSSVVSIEWGNN